MSAVTGLTNLEDLDLRFNQVTDLRPLVDNPGLDFHEDEPGAYIRVEGNPLECDAQDLEDIEALENRNVTLLHDC